MNKQQYYFLWINWTGKWIRKNTVYFSFESAENAGQFALEDNAIAVQILGKGERPSNCPQN